jgi:hypothetical protein
MDENKSSIGSIIATVIIIALIVLGSLYFWGKRLEQVQSIQTLTAGATTSEPVVNQIIGTTSPAVSTSTKK